MTLTPTLDISYVIPFKDWGASRLMLATRSALDSLGSASGEVIVSDYGSVADPAGQKELQLALEAMGARYLYTPTDGVWSRSRALNAGFAISRGAVLVAADADMLAPPGCLEETARLVLSDPNTAVYYTCVDLPPRWDDNALRRKGIDWESLRRSGTPRPRWGMGLNAVSRELFDRVRGWDERFLVYGGEDNDFSHRIRRAGARVMWAEGDAFAMLHIWHKPTSAVHAASGHDSLQVASNKWISRHDLTFVRNTLAWRYRPADSAPLVSVVIATHNRREMLGETILSVQAQTMQDFEIIVVDDGSTDDTAEFIQSLEDPRIVYVRQDNAGIAAARNRGTDVANGHYIAVLDDDDLMVPWRLETHFEAMTDGPCVTFGSFVNFDNTTGDMSLYATREMTRETAASRGGAPGHSTWLVPTDVMRKVRYDETLTSGVDNDLALRLLRAGVRWQHTGRVMVMRRMHATQVTVTDGAAQMGSASSALSRLRFSTVPEKLGTALEPYAGSCYVPVREAGDLEASLNPYLPDHLVTRTRLRRVHASDTSSTMLIRVERSNVKVDGYIAEPASWADLARPHPAGHADIVLASLQSDDVPIEIPEILVHDLIAAELESAASSVLETQRSRETGIALALVQEADVDDPDVRITTDGHVVTIRGRSIRPGRRGARNDVALLLSTQQHMLIDPGDLTAFRDAWLSAALSKGARR
ncbi:MAG: glycosyltransferase [Arachnia sp.]